MKIIAFAVLLAMASVLQAKPRLIYFTPPTVFPGARLIHPTNFKLIPTTRPLILPGAPTVNPRRQLLVPTKLPLVPSGTGKGQS